MTVAVKQPVCVPDWDILAFQWDPISICALSGAAEGAEGCWKKKAMIRMEKTMRMRMQVSPLVFFLTNIKGSRAMLPYPFDKLAEERQLL